MYTVIIALSFFTLSLGVITSVPLSDEESEKKYGDACEANQYCHGELVSCHHGICLCFIPEDMTYDDASQGCKVLAGNKCEINSELWKVSVSCVEGASCDPSGVCICLQGFYPSANGTCTRKKAYKEVCTTNEECDGTNTKALVCVDGACACDKRGKIYDAEKRSCVSTVDAECQDDDEEFECTSGAICQQGKCVCKSGFAKSSSGKCDLGFGSECNSVSGQHCADIYFACINAQCQCKNPLHQVFDERTQECLSLVFGPCTFPKKDFLDSKKNATGIYDIQKCIRNALCVDKGFYSECECKPGFVQTKGGTCAPGYGESCEVDECDPITPLFCRNNKCECNDLLQTWDPTIKKCVGLIGSRCTRDKPNCVEFASCVVPGSDIAGQCLCDRYAIEVANRTCVYSV